MLVVYSFGIIQIRGIARFLQRGGGGVGITLCQIEDAHQIVMLTMSCFRLFA